MNTVARLVDTEPAEFDPFIVEGDAVAAEAVAGDAADEGATSLSEPWERRGPMRPERWLPARARLGGPLLAKTFHGLDAVGGVACAGLILWGWAPAGIGALSLADALPVLAGALTGLWALRLTQAYAFPRSESLGRHLARVLGAFVIAALAAGAVAAVAGSGDEALRRTASWLCLAFPVAWLMHAIWWMRVRRWRRDGLLTPNVVVVGATPNAGKLIESALGTGEAAVLGVFDDRTKQGRAPDQVGGVPVLGDTEDLLNHRILPYVDRIVVAVSAVHQDRVRGLIAKLGVLPNPVTLFLDVAGVDGQASALCRLADAPLAQMTGVPDDANRILAKRAQDLVIGTVALIAAAPAMALIALAVKLDSPGPILFRQRRHGFNNEEITVLKFRSMRHELRDETASRQVCACDDRVTRVGGFIRKASLDELPQIFNVLKGEMSLVGPRPHAIGMKTGQVESSRLVAEYAWRHRIKPGITGWAQINGSRGPVDTAEQMRRRVALDVEYIERQSFWLDLKIMLLTLPRLLGDRHAVR